MYIPRENRWQNLPQIVAYMRAYAFATLLHEFEGRIQATHLPFLIKLEGDKIYLSSHLARANPQAKLLANKESLVIFSGAQAYISPRHYLKTQTVPTWDYAAVHAYGQARILEESPEAWAVFEELMQQEDPTYFENTWGELPDSYKNGLFRGTVPFVMEVQHLEAKAKLSQDKSHEERQRIIEELSQSPNSNQQIIAELMRQFRD